MSEPADLELTLTLVPADIARGYVHVALGSNRRSRLLPLALSGVVIAVGLALFQLARGGRLPLPTQALLAVLFVLVAGTPLAIQALAIRAHRLLPSNRARWTVGRDGIVVASGGRRERIAWDRIARVDETRHALYVYTSATSFRIVPLRGLPPEVRSALVDRLRRRC